MLKQITKVFQSSGALCQHQSVRYRWRIRGKRPGEAKTLQQILEARNYVDPEIARRIDIGLPQVRSSKKDELAKQVAYLKERKRDKELERSARNGTLTVPLDEVRKEWLKSEAPNHIKHAAEHYGIFKDLFGYAEFTPIVDMDIVYPQSDGKLAPVHRGNVVKPHEAASAPTVTFSSEPSQLWTLVLTNPDGHLTEDNKEYVHWLVGNIPGGDVNKGEIVYDYLQPFPPKGVGFQRLVFVLYKQDQKIDYSTLKKTIPCRILQDRTFETLEFYRERQEVMTPGGLAFFQTDWDKSVNSVFYDQLNMEEPQYEYDFTPPYVAPQKWFPRRKPFNMYLDKYRDKKDIAKDFLLKKLADLNPFETPQQPFPYPNIYRVDRKKTPSWLLTEQRRVKLGLGRINNQNED